MDASPTRMPLPWLAAVRRLLRDIGCAKRRATIAKPDKDQLELLNITIQHTLDISGLENICVIEDFLSDNRRQRERDCMRVLFRPKTSADFCSKYVSSVLSGWIAEDMSECTVDSVRITRKPVLRIPNDTHTDGVRAELTALFRQESKKAHIYVTLLTRRECGSGTLITSAELYTLFSTAAKHLKKQPLVDFVEVRMLVVYSRWVQIVTARTTPFYVTSILEGRDNIVEQMKICQTPWFDFTRISGQQYILLAVFESTRMQYSNVRARVPLRDIIHEEQNSNSLKRKISPAEEHGNYKKRIHTSDGTTEAFPVG